MSRRGPQGKGNEARIKSFIANLMANRPDEIRNAKGEPSSVKIARLYHEETGDDVTRQTVANYLNDKDLINYTQVTIPESNTRLQEIDKRIAIAKNISSDESQKAGDRCKALNTYNSLIKTKIDYEEKLMSHKLRQAEIKRPIHQIVFGHFENVEKTCPKCGHRFYDIPAKDQDSVEKAPKPEFKTGNGQSTIYKSDNDGNEKSK
jgi:rubrerythrin